MCANRSRFRLRYKLVTALLIPMGVGKGSGSVTDEEKKERRTGRLIIFPCIRGEEEGILLEISSSSSMRAGSLFSGNDWIPPLHQDEGNNSFFFCCCWTAHDPSSLLTRDSQRKGILFCFLRYWIIPLSVRLREESVHQVDATYVSFSQTLRNWCELFEYLMVAEE